MHQPVRQPRKWVWRPVIMHQPSTALLGIDPIRQEMKFDEHNPLECDLLIVDEVSMIDIELMASLMKAIGSSTAILFVGDKDQLPSIGPGKCLEGSYPIQGC